MTLVGWVSGFEDKVNWFHKTKTFANSREAYWLLHEPRGFTFNNSTFCPHSVFMCFVWT
jgi:hypothetical protein